MRKGFTLVEILFVVIIAASVLAFSVPAYKRSQERAGYMAATGTLMDIGNAIQSLKRDTNVLPDFPYDARQFRIQRSTYSHATSGLTLDEFFGTVAYNQPNQWFNFALFKFGYLEPLPTNTNYRFYAVRENATICNSQCGAAGVVACMCKSGAATGCFYGARYMSDGTIVRLKGTDCND